MVGMEPSLIEKALAAAGGAEALARETGRAAWGFRKWVRLGVPTDQILWLCERGGWQVTPHELDAAIYPNARDGLPKRRRAEAAA